MNDEEIKQEWMKISKQLEIIEKDRRKYYRYIHKHNKIYDTENNLYDNEEIKQEWKRLSEQIEIIEKDRRKYYN